MSRQSLGELYDPLGAHLADPYPFYARARAEEPVFRSERFSTWVVTRYDDVREVLRRMDAFSSQNALRPLAPPHPQTFPVFAQGYPLAPTAIGSDGEQHARLRAPFAKGLAPDRVASLEGFIRERAEAMVAGFAADGHADLMAQFANPLAFGVIAHLIGIEPSDMDAAYEGSYNHAMLTGSNMNEADEVATAKAAIAFQHLMVSYLHRRQEEPRDDLATEIAVALADDPEGVRVWAIVGLVLAGHTTTSALLGNGLRHLLADRGQWELLVGAPEQIPSAVEEIARFDPSVQTFFRLATKDVTLGGVDLPAGSELLLVYGAANRDETLCDQPETFDVTRTPTKHLAWAAGPHYCVGAGLARKQVTVALDVITRRLPGLRLVPDQEIAIRPSLAMRGPMSLLAEW